MGRNLRLFRIEKYATINLVLWTAGPRCLWYVEHSCWSGAGGRHCENWSGTEELIDINFGGSGSGGS
eukprot:168681-Ditylum_brightwellii.AAC.1